MRIVIICLLALGLLIQGAMEEVGAKDIVRVVTTTKHSDRIVGDGPTIREVRPGWEVELLMAVGERVGTPIEIYRMPWKKALVSVQKGVNDGAFNASYKLERAQYCDYPMADGKPDSSRSLYHYSYWLYMYDETSVSWDGEALKGVTRPVAVERNAAVIGKLKKLGVPYLEVQGYEEAVDLLYNDRVDAIAGFDRYVEDTIAKNPGRYEGIVRASLPLTNNVGYLMLSKGMCSDDPALCEHIWDAIRDIKNTPDFQSVIKSYASEK